MVSTYIRQMEYMIKSIKVAFETSPSWASEGAMLIRQQMPGAMPLASGKRAALCILIAVLAASFSVNAESRPSSSVLTVKLRMLCGRSDVVWNYIVSIMGEKTLS